jgi:RNA polymerase sigma-70 factor (ECF subfamily)
MNDAVIFMENDLVLHPLDDISPDMETGLMDCIEKLKNEQKECIRQFYFMDRCYKEIALDLDLDEKKVKSYLQNAKRNLKLCLEEKNAGQK